VLDRKPRNKEIQFYSGNFKRLKLLDVFNPKSAIRNPKSCLNGLFVQALVIIHVVIGKEKLNLSFTKTISPGSLPRQGIYIVI